MEGGGGGWGGGGSFYQMLGRIAVAVVWQGLQCKCCNADNLDITIDKVYRYIWFFLMRVGYFIIVENLSNLRVNSFPLITPFVPSTLDPPL